MAPIKLSTLEARGSFALLGPGFDEGRWSLLTDLRPDPRGPLVFAAFEAPGDSPLRFSGRLERDVQLDWDVAPRTLKPRLHADGYADAIEQIRSDIAAGDVYQVCLTLRADLPRCPGAALFSQLCARGTPRFAAWVRFDEANELVSASPELLLEVRGDQVRSEPMKGTAAPGEDAALHASEKDEAELAMIVDLVRNDLTPVCVPRSIRVLHERRVLTLPYALQTVADVTGTLAPETTIEDVLGTLHPGGSVTGAPKHAALERIRALEPGPRGAYCGTLGLSLEDRATFALLIRTAQKTQEGWVYGVGSGVVYDSEPEKELAELHTKLGALG